MTDNIENKMHQKTKTNVVFVVLTYRNTEDICSFYNSLVNNIKDFRVIIVNNHYDEETKMSLNKFASEHNCMFFDIPNEGYSTGNNFGIKIAEEKFDFNYLVVSNPDITVEKLDLSIQPKDGITGPEIIARTGKKQNPYWALRNPLGEWFIYRGFIKNNFYVRAIGLGINKIVRMIFQLSTLIPKAFRRVYAVHGSFVIFSKEALHHLEFKPFDENIFLFCEEAVLAHVCKELKINMYYTNKVIVHHKEDGSMELAKVKTSNEQRKSFIYYYEKYVINRL